MADPPRRYGDAEIARLLERASELQVRGDGGGGEGLTLEELREVAGEAGIDPEMISAAAAELEAADPPAHRAAPIAARCPAAPGVESTETRHIVGEPSAWVETTDLAVHLAEEDVARLIRRVEADLAREGSTSRDGP